MGFLSRFLMMRSNAIAEIACEVNENTENIGARRLHTVLERLMEEISYSGGDTQQSLHVDANYVDMQLSALVKNQDLSRYITLTPFTLVSVNPISITYHSQSRELEIWYDDTESVLFVCGIPSCILPFSRGSRPLFGGTSASDWEERR